MINVRSPSRLALALLATTMLTAPGPARAAPGDALGPEFQVNSFTTGDQRDPAIAMDADGDFVVVWTDFGGQDGDSYGIFAQRYDAAGLAQGPEVQVNSFTTGPQRWPSVAMDADGDFVVAWSRYDPTAGAYALGVFAQRYDAAGSPQGGEFQVNTMSSGTQALPSVAMDADGDFVVAWLSYDLATGSSYGISARRYEAAGVPQGAEITVDSSTTGGVSIPTVAIDAEGDFIVAWTNYPYGGAFARRYDAAGSAQGPSFQVGSGTSGAHIFPSVAMDADGDFVVAWVNYTPGIGVGVLAQRYNAAGVLQGPELRVSTSSARVAAFPDWDGDVAVAMDTDGDFVVAWTDASGQDGSDYGIFARRYDAAGMPLGSEVQVNSFTTGEQIGPSVAMDADGDFVVAWQDGGESDDGQDGSSGGIFAQRYDGAERVEGDFDGDGNADLLWRNAGNGDAVIWLMEGTKKRASKKIGTVRPVWEIAGTGDFNGDGKADILWRNTKSGEALVWQMNGFTKEKGVSIGKVKPVWVIEKVEDTNGDGHADIFWRNENTNESIVWQMLGYEKVATGKPGKVKQVWQVQ